jgi:hypothetical protein
MHDRDIGSSLLVENIITANTYLGILQLFVFEETGDIEQKQEGEILLQQDGASPHFSHEAQNVLNVGLPNGWIGRGEPMTWPPRSPDPLSLGSFYRDL